MEPSKTPKHPMCPTKHSMKRRARCHNYSEPGTYLITLVVEGRLRLFGLIAHTPYPHVEYTPLGKEILDTEIHKICTVHKNVELWGVVVMPDHLHLIVNVNKPFEDKKHLGKVVIGFKSGCNRAHWRLNGYTGAGIFERGYNDGILMNDGQLERWKHYIQDNPRRLSLKILNRDYFTVIRDLEICGKKCQILGNRFLLNIPDKMAVIVHRADSDEVYGRKFNEWMACARRGGVLISAAIAKREKQVLRAAMDEGLRIILLRENGFPELYKPSGEKFDACANGQLLEISPNDYHFDRRTITRAQCLELNRLATEIENDQKSWY